jgi:hypothetical protein
LKILVTAEPWKISRSWLWTVFGLIVLVILLLIPGMYFYDKRFNTGKYDRLLEIELNRIALKDDQPEADWIKRNEAIQISNDARS